MPASLVAIGIVTCDCIEGINDYLSFAIKLSKLHVQI